MKTPALSMLLSIMRAEWINLRRERSIWGAMLVLAIAFGLASALAHAQLRQERAAQAFAFDEERDRSGALRGALAQSDAKPNEDPRDPLLVGQELYARVSALPLNSMAALSMGQRDVVPQLLRITTAKIERHPASATSASPLRKVSGDFDVSFILVFLLPLWAIGLAYDLLSSERERGTLAMVLSQPISVHVYLLGKLLLRAFVLTTVTLLALWLSLWVPAPAPVDFGFWLMASCLVTLYIAFWFALCWLVNSWSKSSAANALALVACWIGMVVLIPALSGAWVEATLPSPSRVEFANAEREAARAQAARKVQLEGDHGKAAQDKAARDVIGAQRDLESALSHLHEDFDQSLRNQQRTVDQLRFASPALVLSDSLLALAGGHHARHQEFADQTHRFQAELQQFYFSRAEAGAVLTPADYAATPRFAFRDVPASSVLQRVAWAFVWLATAVSVLFALGARALRSALRDGVR